LNTAVTDTTGADKDNVIARVRALLERGQFGAAAAAAQAVGTDPANRELLYMLAVAQRYLQQIPAALATLAQLESFHPRYPRLFQERGHCHAAQRQADRAIAAFERAVQLNPALPASWNALQTLYRMTGRPDQARNAADSAARLAQMPPAVVTAYSMYADGEVLQAEQVIREFLRTNPYHVEGMRLLAKIGIDLDVLDDAEVLLDAVLKMAPNHQIARYDLVVALLKQHKHLRAQQEIAKILESDPNNPECRSISAATWLGLGQVDRAISMYQALLNENPYNPDLHLSLGHAFKTRGSQAEAVDAYRKATLLRTQFGEAYWSLANLKIYQFTDEELERMRAAEAAPTIQLADRFHLCFALGKALEDRRDHAQSFVYYERGNALRKQQSGYRVEDTERNTREQSAVCTREFFSARQGFGCKSRAPIFIVGLPRAGSTLIEQILASHSEVEGTMELAEIPRLAGALRGRQYTESLAESRYPAILAELAAEDFERFGNEYLADSAVYRAGRPRFIDKNPNNFRHVGLMHLMLPNAKIIDARREPMACCFSNFKQLFAAGQQFTYSLEEIGRYYRTYVELMRHCDQVLPGKVLRVQHEDVLDDLEGSVRRILEFCELGFEPACIEFYKTERRIHTASSEQVRRPIFREGLDQWRHFEPWLEPLKTALGPCANS
jgi:tetratricopeptide (TPR) repeat protein